MLQGVGPATDALMALLGERKIDEPMCRVWYAIQNHRRTGDVHWVVTRSTSIVYTFPASGHARLRVDSTYYHGRYVREVHQQ